MPKVYFPNENRTIEVPYGANLRRAALDNGIDVYGFPAKFLNCGGHGLCGTCKVAVEPDWNLSDRTNAEIRKLKAAPLRLSCQANVEGDITCYTQIPIDTTRAIETARCYIVISRPRLQMVQEVVGNEFQRNVFLDLTEAEMIAREVAELYPDGNWEIREFADPLTTQEFSFSYNPLRYIRATPHAPMADGEGDTITATLTSASGIPG
ncbi:MAG: 2Fe-2S iron-sulfur cluster-binding protein [Thermomicrobiales bacterium]